MYRDSLIPNRVSLNMGLCRKIGGLKVMTTRIMPDNRDLMLDGDSRFLFDLCLKMQAKLALDTWSQIARLPHLRPKTTSKTLLQVPDASGNCSDIT